MLPRRKRWSRVRRSRRSHRSCRRGCNGDLPGKLSSDRHESAQFFDGKGPFRSSKGAESWGACGSDADLERRAGCSGPAEISYVVHPIKAPTIPAPCIHAVITPGTEGLERAATVAEQPGVRGRVFDRPVPSVEQEEHAVTVSVERDLQPGSKRREVYSGVKQSGQQKQRATAKSCRAACRAVTHAVVVNGLRVRTTEADGLQWHLNLPCATHPDDESGQQVRRGG